MNASGLDAAIADYRRTTTGSAVLYERARQRIPGGSTRSASWLEPYPLYLERGAGSRVWDVDGVARTDFDSNYTVLIHGQCFGPIVQAMTTQAATAHCFTAGSRHEVALAEAIGARLPSVASIRFTSSGTEAAVLAIRAARAFTGREKIAKFVGGYHGSSELASVNTPWLAGSREDGESIAARADGPGVARASVDSVVPLPFNDIDGVRRMLAPQRGQIAAVIVEPVLGAGGLIAPEPGFLAALRELTARDGALLVFDEVIMFRLSYGGAQGLFGVYPDLTLLGKIIGGGLPVGAVGGRRDVMAVFDVSQPVCIRHSGTYNANPMTAAAGLASLQALTPPVFARIADFTRSLIERARRVLRDHRVPASISAVESIFNLQALPQPARQHSQLVAQDRTLLRTLHLGLLNAGVLVTPTGLGCVSTVMDASDADAFIDGLEYAIRRYLQAQARC